jgi:hypothetical protein
MSKKHKIKELGGLIKFMLYTVCVFGVMLLLYFGINMLAKKNSHACKFIGNVWLVGSKSDPNARKGCFTYRELYSL